jgi:hypothetical protein
MAEVVVVAEAGDPAVVVDIERDDPFEDDRLARDLEAVGPLDQHRRTVGHHLPDLDRDAGQHRELALEGGADGGAAVVDAAGAVDEDRVLVEVRDQLVDLGVLPRREERSGD